ncbi:MAG: (4S)-4-hydroxy-5-phosphonooxypentane-2,3-dione isomerase [Bryobacterales bacterium]|jgi:quinol monooxygenase YgiN|nr:(4S)-4-hydroxy-5-phosphonooxypentane-2,3-dione isomerase [Bryobacterales bacterium]
MLILQVQIHVLPESIEAFRAATIENVTHSLQEPGIARFDFLQHAEDPNRFSLCEVYRDDAAAAAHRASAHWAKWTETVAPMMAEPRVRTWYKTIFPGDEAW